MQNLLEGLYMSSKFMRAILYCGLIVVVVAGIFYTVKNTAITECEPDLVFKAEVAQCEKPCDTYSKVVDGVNYLFLPSGKGLEQISLSVVDKDGKQQDPFVSSSMKSTGELLSSLDNLATLNLSSLGGNKADSEGLVLWVRKDKATDPQKVVIMQSKSISSVFITSNSGRDKIDASKMHSLKDTGEIVVLDSNGESVYTGDLKQLRGRGNSTWTSSAKKPYQVKLNEKADLIGSGEKNCTWVLLANAADATLVRNSICLDLAHEMGIESTPTSAPCDLYFDGEYIGSYLLSEKCQVGECGVDIDNLTDITKKTNKGNDAYTKDDPNLKVDTNSLGYKYQYVEGVKSPENISGGYLVEYDFKPNGEISVFDTQIAPFTVKCPKVASKEEAKFISEKVGSGIDSIVNATLVSDHFDLDSLCSSGWMEEFVCDPDYLEMSSTYFYVKQDDPKIYCGPMWDFDRAFYQHTSHDPFAFARVVVNDNKEVFDECKKVHKDKLRPLVDIILGDINAGSSNSHLHSLDWYTQRVSHSQKMDEVVWGLTPLRDDWLAYTPSTGSTYEDGVEQLRDFMINRIEYLDKVVKQDTYSIDCWCKRLNRSCAYKKDGKFVHSCWIDVDGDTYYIAEDGIRAKGWIEVDGKQYYLDDACKLVRGTHKIDNVEYKFDDKDGHLIEE